MPADHPAVLRTAPCSVSQVCTWVFCQLYHFLLAANPVDTGEGGSRARCTLRALGHRGSEQGCVRGIKAELG